MAAPHVQSENRTIEERLDRIERLLEHVAQRVDAVPNPEPRADPTDGEWLTAKDCAERFGLSLKALYSDVARGGRFAAAASRMGRRLRFHRHGLDRLPLQVRSRKPNVRLRVPSPGKESERW